MSEPASSLHVDCEQRSRRRVATASATLAGSVLLSAVGCSSPSSTEPEGWIPWRDQSRSVVLAIEPSALEGVSKRRSPTDAAADLMWTNLLTEEFGFCDVVAATEIEADPRARLSGRRILVLPRATVARLGSPALSALETLVDEGLTVIVERPDTTHARHLGLRVATAERAPRLPWPFEAAQLAADARGGLGGFVPGTLPLSHRVSRYAPAEDPRRRARVAREVAGRPAVWSLERGNGAWLTLAHELSDWSRSYRQAAPGSQSTQAIVVPWVEAWLACVMSGDAAQAPWPRLARHAPASTGWLALSHPPTSESSLGGHRGFAPARALLGSGRLDRQWALPAQVGTNATDPLSSWISARLDHNRDTVRGVVHAASADSGPTAIEALEALARSSGALAIPASAFLRWWEERAEADLRWNFDGEELIVDVDTSALSTEGLVLQLPRRWRTLRLVDWSAGWSPAPARTYERFGEPLLLVDVPAGTQARVRARYR